MRTPLNVFSCRNKKNTYPIPPLILSCGYHILSDEWLMFDDDNVTPITSEDVLKLSGGGKYIIV